jgi:isopenicillin N synthase-like dioxygenase
MYMRWSLVVGIVLTCLLTGRADTASEQKGPPVINVAPLLHPYVASLEEGAKSFEELSQASQRWGFYYIENHDISDELIERLESQMKLFFSLPLSEKLTIKRQVDNSRGYANDELTKRLLDLKEVYDFGPENPLQFHNYSSTALKDAAIDGVNQWISSEILPSFKPTLEAYYEASRSVSVKLMQSIARFLCCFSDVSFFDNQFRYHTSLFRLNHYPKNIPESTETTDSTESEKLGISRHTDAGVLTILWQDPRYFGALEVYSGSKQDANDGEWIPVDPLPGTLTVNNGDMLQVWTNNFFKAAEHRVRATANMKTGNKKMKTGNKDQGDSNEIARLSAAFFLNPNYDTLVKPHLSCHLLPPSSFNGAKRVIPQNKIRDSPWYRPIRWGDFRIQRFKGDYADHGEEIQIEHFRVGMEDDNEQLEEQE